MHFMYDINITNMYHFSDVDDWRREEGETRNPMIVSKLIIRETHLELISNQEYIPSFW